MQRGRSGEVLTEQAEAASDGYQVGQRGERKSAKKVGGAAASQCGREGGRAAGRVGNFGFITPGHAGGGTAEVGGAWLAGAVVWCGVVCYCEYCDGGPPGQQGVAALCGSRARPHSDVCNRRRILKRRWPWWGNNNALIWCEIFGSVGKVS